MLVINLTTSFADNCAELVVHYSHSFCTFFGSTLTGADSQIAVAAAQYRKKEGQTKWSDIFRVFAVKTHGLINFIAANLSSAANATRQSNPNAVGVDTEMH